MTADFLVYIVISADRDIETFDADDYDSTTYTESLTIMAKIAPPDPNIDFIASLVANANTMTASRYFEPGTYLVSIENCKIRSNRQGRPRAIVECTLIDSNNATFDAGSNLAWVVSLDTDSGPSDLKTWLVAMSGLSEREMTDSEIAKQLRPDPTTGVSRFSGRQAIVQAFSKTTKAGGSFTVVSFKPFDPNTDKVPNFRTMTQRGDTPTTEAVLAANNWSLPATDDESIPF